MMDLTSLYKRNSNSQVALHSRYFVEGIIVGAASCPEIPVPNVWMPWLFKQDSLEINDPEITDELFNYFKFCLNEMRNDRVKVPGYVIYSDVTAPDFVPRSNAPLEKWCKGILTAHGATEESWQSAWHKMYQRNPEKAPDLAKDLKHCLMMFTTFSDPQKKIQQSETPDELTRNLPIIAMSLDRSLRTYVNISGELASYLPNQFETFAQQQ